MENNQSDKNQKQCCSTDKKCCIPNPKCALMFSSVLFGLVALVHLYRIFYFFPVTIGTVAVAPGVSIAAFIVFGLLSIWMYCAACKISK
jgi:hypothetical protein